MKKVEGVPNVLVVATILSLRELMDKEPIAFHELVQKCRNADHDLFGNSYDTLLKRELIQGNGQPHKAIRQIVLAHVQGEGFDLTLEPKT